MLFTVFSYKLMRIKRGSNYLILMLIISLNSIFTPVIAQQLNSADTSATFLVKDLQELVLLNHPIVKQAGLLSKEAQAKVFQSLGKFDPELIASLVKKLSAALITITTGIVSLKSHYGLVGPT